MKQNRVPGLSIAIVHADDVKSLAFGLSSVQDQTPCTTDTLFDIASSSKALTGGAIALLVNDETFPQVQYDAKMSELLPDDFVLSEDSYTKTVTIDDLLGHRTGMPGYGLFPTGIPCAYHVTATMTLTWDYAPRNPIMRDPSPEICGIWPLPRLQDCDTYTVT